MDVCASEAPRRWRRGLWGLSAALLMLCAESPAQAAVAAPQQDPELRAVVQDAIRNAECFTDQYDSAVWYTLMEPRLRRYNADKDERLRILKTVYCETHRKDATLLPPGLVLGIMDVESRFNRWAISSASAVGLMQVMPFWPEKLGMQRRQLMEIEANIRMGCAILRFYLAVEHNDVRKALARYNGSVGRREYPDLVITRWSNRWAGADDLGRTAVKPS
ncbi:MAG: lytic transglycosylase domain-containing protein [Steroidobacteraceae bacterium]